MVEDCKGRLPLELAATIAEPGKEADGEVLRKLLENMAECKSGCLQKLSDAGEESILRVFDLHFGKGYLNESWLPGCQDFAESLLERMFQSAAQTMVAAAGAGLKRIVEYSMGQGVSVNSCILNRGMFFVTPLDAAILGGHAEVARYLVHQGALPWSLGGKLMKAGTPTLEWVQAAAEHYSSIEGQLCLPRLNALLRMAPDSGFDTGKVLHRALTEEGPRRALSVLRILTDRFGGLKLGPDYEALLGTLLKEVASDFTKEDTYLLKMILDVGDAGATAKGVALCNAASSGLSGRAIRILIEARADATCKSQWGNTPLHFLCLRGRETRAVKLLISCKADPQAANYAGKSPMHYLALGTTGNHTHAIAGQLISARADVNARIVVKEESAALPGVGMQAPFHFNLYPGMTCLHLACQQRCQQRAITMVNSFLKLKADPNAQDSIGQMPLHVAVPNGLANVVHVLLEARAFMDACSDAGESPKKMLRTVSEDVAHRPSRKERFSIMRKAFCMTKWDLS
eukprot:gnl/MRDRNA2_/MRDRNA2_139566_c0_seq1.p1 gnl/MRDRNA2_/MRDRNA2_139566_c0~~gnl/MRDRNA2_/MRDRNA2_139566_c0_seq1.p1  ORF type:complete len:559 (+),score=83.44 gnl/MRDRNA2_/MRDRNA2_139566_c0_seq1:133-1677(+)